MALLEKKVRTCLWFQKGGAEAAEFYISLLPESRIDGVMDHGVPDDPMVVEYTLAGAPMMHLTGGPHFKMTPAASISVLTKDQAETDRLWSALLTGGGEESRCGWLTDRYGLSWQIIPERLIELQRVPDREAAGRVRDAMMKMRRIEVAALESAFAG